MTTAIKTRVIDGDGHITEVQEEIAKFLPSPYQDIVRAGSLFPPLDHLHSARAVETPPQRDKRPRVGPEGWLSFLDDVNIEWTVLYPTNGLAYGKIVSKDYAVALCRAYNDWIYNTYLRASPRFKAMGLIPLQDPEAAVVEL